MLHQSQGKSKHWHSLERENHNHAHYHQSNKAMRKDLHGQILDISHCTVYLAESMR